MDILGKARKLESALARTLETAVQGVVGPSARQPIEVLHAIVEAAEGKVQPAGRGRRMFPFNRMHVQIAAPTREDRARFEALVQQAPSLRDRVLDRLHAAGCDARDLEMQVSYAARPKAGWTTAEYDLAFDRVEVPAAPVPAETPAPRLELTVTAGSAARRSYTFTGGRIDIGRRGEVLDHRQRLLRTNHVAFSEEGSEANKTVSRKHAHSVYVEAAREYRLKDDGSAHGTAVLRHGHTIPVPQGSRGARLQSGDEIALGEAKLCVRIH